MSTGPEFLPPDPEPYPSTFYPAEEPTAPPVRHVPHIGHALLFLAIVGGSMMVVEILAYALAAGLHLFPHDTSAQLLTDPRLLVPAQCLSYLVAGLIAIVIFSAMWRRPFAEGVRWDLGPVRQHRWLLVGAGVAVSIVSNALSNFLPIPKNLPIDDMFRTPADVWMAAIFGIFVAPPFEELAFRGFMLPSLATAWEWLTRRRAQVESVEIEAAAWAPTLQPLTPLVDQKWSKAAVVFASALTSVCFALLHSAQLAHAYAPLGVLFCVSLVLCVVRLRYHSLAASTLVHACYNGTIFVALFIGTSGFRHLEKLQQ